MENALGVFHKGYSFSLSIRAKRGSILSTAAISSSPLSLIKLFKGSTKTALWCYGKNKAGEGDKDWLGPGATILHQVVKEVIT